MKIPLKYPIYAMRRCGHGKGWCAMDVDARMATGSDSGSDAAAAAGAQAIGTVSVAVSGSDTPSVSPLPEPVVRGTTIVPPHSAGVVLAIKTGKGVQPSAVADPRYGRVQLAEADFRVEWSCCLPIPWCFSASDYNVKFRGSRRIVVPIDPLKQMVRPHRIVFQP